MMSSMTHLPSVTMFLGRGTCQISDRLSRSRHRSSDRLSQEQSGKILTSFTLSGTHLPWISGFCQIYRSDRHQDQHCHVVLTVQSPLDRVWYSFVGSDWFHLCFTSVTHSLYLGSIWFSWWFVIACIYPPTYPLFHSDLL